MCYNLFRFIFEFDDWMQANLGMHVPFQVITWMERKVCDTLARREKFIIISAWGEDSEKITTWLANVGIMLMLDNLIWRKKFCQRTNPAWWEKDIMTHVLIVFSRLGNSLLEYLFYYFGIDWAFPLCYSH
jgi:hypothetical protein